MPLKHHLGRLAAAEHGIVAPRLRQFDLIPADLLHAIRIDSRTKRLGHKLRAEADAEDRQFGIDRLPNPADFIGKKRITIRLVHIHRPAHHDQPRKLLWMKLARRLAKQIDHAACHSLAPQGILNRPQPLVGYMAKSENWFHNSD